MPQTLANLDVAPDQFGLRHEAERYLGRVTVPALTFHAGRQDPAAVAAWERSQFQHPYSKAVAWEGTGHWLRQERPAEFNASRNGSPACRADVVNCRLSGAPKPVGAGHLSSGDVESSAAAGAAADRRCARHRHPNNRPGPLAPASRYAHHQRESADPPDDSRGTPRPSTP